MPKFVFLSCLMIFLSLPYASARAEEYSAVSDITLGGRYTTLSCQESGLLICHQDQASGMVECPPSDFAVAPENTTLDLKKLTWCRESETCPATPNLKIESAKIRNDTKVLSFKLSNKYTSISVQILDLPEGSQKAFYTRSALTTDRSETSIFSAMCSASPEMNKSNK